MSLSLFLVLCIVCLIHVSSSKEATLLYITALFIGLPPLIRITFEIGGEYFFLYYAFIEVCYLVAISKVDVKEEVFKYLILLGCISITQNLYEYSTFYEPNLTYQYYEVIQATLYDFTLFGILSNVSFKLISTYLLILWSYPKLWEYLQYFLT